MMTDRIPIHFFMVKHKEINLVVLVLRKDAAGISTFY